MLTPFAVIITLVGSLTKLRAFANRADATAFYNDACDNAKTGEVVVLVAPYMDQLVVDDESHMVPAPARK